MVGCAGSSLLCAGSLWLQRAGATLRSVSGLLAVSSLAVERRLWGAWASAAVAHGLICPEACGIFEDQGSNLCPLHWQADS